VKQQLQVEIVAMEHLGEAASCPASVNSEFQENNQSRKERITVSKE
jgi:hypothetical protein